MSDAADNRDQKNTKLQIKQPRLEKHNARNISRAILNTLDNYGAMFEVDVFEGKRLLYSYGKTEVDDYTVYSFETTGGEFHYNSDKACIWAKYTVPIDNKGLKLAIDIYTGGKLNFSVSSEIRLGDRDDGDIFKAHSLKFEDKGNNHMLFQNIRNYEDDIAPDGKSAEVVLPFLPKNVDITVVPDLKEYKTTSDRRLVLFMGTDIAELSCFLGYITESSKYIAPNMYNTTLGYWINIGPIYGQVDINTMDNRFYLSFERDYQSGKLVNEFIRTSFMPLREGLGLGEYVVLTNELWYVKYYDPRGSGKTITQEDFIEYNNTKATALSQYLPNVLNNLLNYK